MSPHTFIAGSGCCYYFEMSDVDQFLASVSGVELKNCTMSGVGKYPFLGPTIGTTDDHNFLPQR